MPDHIPLGQRSVGEVQMNKPELVSLIAMLVGVPVSIGLLAVLPFQGV